MRLWANDATAAFSAFGVVQRRELSFRAEQADMLCCSGQAPQSIRMARSVSLAE